MDYSSTSFEEFRNLPWGSADGRKTHIKDLELSHLVNILNWVKARPNQYDPTLLPKLIEEAEYRRLLAFAAGEPIPQQNDTGEWVLIDTNDGVIDWMLIKDL